MTPAHTVLILLLLFRYTVLHSAAAAPAGDIAVLPHPPTHMLRA
jgi:hypothetical protein